MRRGLPACTAPAPGPRGPRLPCPGIRLPADDGVCDAPARAVKGEAARLGGRPLTVRFDGAFSAR